MDKQHQARQIRKPNPTRSMIDSPASPDREESSIRIEGIPRTTNVEARFRQYLDKLQLLYGPINWNETNITFPAESLGYASLVFRDTSMHADAVRANHLTAFENAPLRWILTWNNHSACNTPPAENVPPPRRTSPLNKANEPSQTSQALSRLRWLTEERLESLVNDSVLSAVSYAFSACEARFSSLSEQAASRALQRAAITTTRMEEQIPLQMIQSFAAQARRAVCPVCQENLGRMTAENVLQQNSCGHYICRVCCDELRARYASREAVPRCPICRTQGYARRGYFLI